jgi:hypothetical protein
MLKIPKMTMRQRAFGYPYEAPDGAYLLRDGYQLDLPETYDFSGRIAVLSVGSNRAPAQLYRKFGEPAEVPVTPVAVKDCDIVHVANLADYGAVPCSAFPSRGTIITLNIAWLTSQQLEIMHATEALGEAYDLIEWDLRAITALSHRLPARLFGYSAIAGAFNLNGNGPFALDKINAQDRQFTPASQKEMQDQIFAALGADAADVYQWVEIVQSDAGLRRTIRHLLAEKAIQPVGPPWQKSDALGG